MKKNETLDAMLAGGVVAVIRMKDAERLSRVVMAIREGGVNCIEITMTVPGAVEIIAGMVKTLPPETVVWPGHDYGERPRSTLQREAETNPYISEYME